MAGGGESMHAPPEPDMIWIPGGTFRMGSNDHYREEAPVHSVTVDGFWMDRHSVTNAEFARFADETGYVTVAERPPDPALYPGAPPENLVPGSLVFQMTEGPVNLRYINQWWAWTPGASWRPLQLRAAVMVSSLCILVLILLPAGLRDVESDFLSPKPRDLLRI